MLVNNTNYTMPQSSIENYLYAGCYVDGSPTVLDITTPTILRNGDDFLVACQRIAQSNNAYYFGLRNGTTCYYGQQSNNLNRYGVKRPDSECYMNCGSSDATLNAFNTDNVKCGSVSRTSIYQLKITVPNPHRFIPGNQWVKDVCDTY